MSTKEEDELDDFSADENEDLDPNVWSIVSSLEQPDAQAITTERLHLLIHQGFIDLEPAYQRDVVWSTAKQMEIIDSIFHNFYVPPVIFSIEIDDEGEETRVCVDGKQRLTSIQKFIDGQIGYRDPRTKQLWWYTVSDAQRKARKEIPPHGKRLFAEKVITCVEYRHLSMAAERDVFQRVQMGMPLKTAEKWQAISSPWADWLNKIETRYVSVNGGLADVISVDTRRGVSFQNLSAMAYAIESLPQQVTPVGKGVEKWLISDEGPTDRYKADFIEVLDRMLTMAPDENLNQAFKQVSPKVSPLEFVFIGVLIYVMRHDDEFSDDDRANAALYLRERLRANNKDIRLNSHLSKQSWTIIEGIEDGSIKPSTRFQPDGASKPPKRKQRPDADDDEGRPASSKAKPGPKKAKTVTNGKTKGKAL